jgi:hypothetical protein
MTAHALLNASGSSRWMSCFGSTALTKDMPDETSAYFEDDTRMHTAASEMLLGLARTVDLDEEEREIVNVYVDYVRREAAGHQLLVEQRVDYSEVIGVPDSFGTSDAIILAGDTIVIVDMKTGRGVKVDAEENEQLQLYALGALEVFGVVGDFTKVKVAIVQPRLDHISEWTMNVTNLRVFGQHARAAAAKVIDMVEGRAELEFNPSEKSCRWCKAKATCPALLAHVQDAVGADFEDLDADDIKMSPLGMGANSLSIAMAAVPLVEDWCKAVRARLEAELLAGKEIPGWKLVQGRNGVRRWGDEEKAAQLLKTFLHDDAFETSLISPAVAEKKMKGSKAAWAQVQTAIVQKPGPPSVAPISDKRPAYSPADDFNVVQEN